MRGLSADGETPHPSAFGRHLLPQGEKDEPANLLAPTPAFSRLSPSAIPFQPALPRSHATLPSFRRMEGS